MRFGVSVALFLLLLAVGAWFGRDYVRKHPQDFPWTDLDLADPVGLFTRAKLVQLGQEPRRCRALLARAGTEDEPVQPRRATPDCGYDDAMRLRRDTGFSPSGLVTSCPVAAALLLWEERVLQPAAERHLGAAVDRIEHAGSYSCRRLYGREEGAFSEHATADAIDITGFRLADGRQISVLRDWPNTGAEATFLREVRTGACDLFATVLSPDYNAAHRDHLHFDQADRGGTGWGLCR